MTVKVRPGSTRTLLIHFQLQRESLKLSPKGQQQDAPIITWPQAGLPRANFFLMQYLQLLSGGYSNAASGGGYFWVPTGFFLATEVSVLNCRHNTPYSS